MKDVFFTFGGLGDTLCLIAAANCYYHVTGKKVTIGSPFPVFEKLYPDICDFVNWIHLSKFGHRVRKETLARCKKNGFNPVFLDPNKLVRKSFFSYKTIFQDKHMIHLLAEKMGLCGYFDIAYPKMSFSDDEALPDVLQSQSGYVCIMTGGLLNYKYVDTSVYQSIVDRYKSQYTFVQIGSAEDNTLKNVVDCRGTDILGSITVLKHASGFIGVTGGLVHLTAAIGIKSFILQTGGEPLSLTFYPLHTYFLINGCIECALSKRDPQHERCPFGYKCIKDIKQEQMFKKLDVYMSAVNKSSPLTSNLSIKCLCNGKLAHGLDDYFKQRKVINADRSVFVRTNN